MYAYRVVIRNNSTGEAVYDSGEITSYTPLYILPVALDIGEYKFKITVYNDVASNVDRNYAESEWKIFHIVPSPTVTVNLNDGDVIFTQNLSLSANYYHPTGTKIKQYQFILYDFSQIVIERSPYLTTKNLEYTFTTSLDNDQTYYTQCIVTTADNIEVGSGLIKFSVEYVRPSVNFNVQVETFYNKPYAKITWNVTRIIGEIIGNGFFVDINNEPVVDNLENSEKLNLLTENSLAIFREGFVIDSNFTINIWVEGINDGVTFFMLENNAGQQIYLNYYQNRIHAWKPMGIYTAHVVSDEINYTGTEQIMIRLQQQNNRIGVFAMIVE